jgi:hypothetical protein
MSPFVVTTPLVYVRNGFASIPQEIGPLLKISFIIAAEPCIDPYSEIVMFGYLLKPAQKPPLSENVEQVLAMFAGVQDQSAEDQNPSFESEEQAMYGWAVSYEMPVPVSFEILWIH